MERSGDRARLLSAPRVITATDDPPLDDGAVLVQEGRITAVGPRGELARTADAHEYHFRDATLLPGLIDCHEHVAGNGRFSTGTTALEEPDAMWAVVFAHYCRWNLAKGVTTLRVPGARHAVDLVVRRAIQEGHAEGPRLVCAGEAIGMTGGHQGAFGLEADGPWGCAQAARRQFALGADFIKAMASGGISAASPGERPTHAQLTVEEMRAIVEVAHARDKRVTTHADGVEGISNALEAGVDCIEHGIYLTEEHARFMAEHGVAVVPTLDCMIGIVHHGSELGLEPSWIDVADELLDVHRRSFQAALDAGVLFATGTDSYGDIVSEIAEFTTYGISRYRAIQAATRDAAAVIGPSADYGTLEPGKSADVIAVEGDPLDAVEQLRQVRMVMSAGDVFSLDERALG